MALERRIYRLNGIELEGCLFSAAIVDCDVIGSKVVHLQGIQLMVSGCCAQGS
ncbi:hypothetical protein D3C73_1445160 [compost metagenome]